jgi:hypothetical protein
MALVIADRVLETTTTTGTGAVTLAGAQTGYQSFGTAVGNGNTTYYTIAVEGGTDWEVGVGTYTSSGTSLSRDTVLASSNSGSLVPFGAGTKNVFVTYAAGKAVYLDASGYLGAQTFNATNAVRSQAAASQDAMVLAGRAGGTSSYAVTLTPTTLTASRTVTMPDANIDFTTGLAIAQGGTGATTAATALSNLGGVTTGKAIAMAIVFGG